MAGLVLTTMSKPFFIFPILMRKISFILRFTRFLTTLFPTLLETETPSRVQLLPFFLMYIVKKGPDHRLPALYTFLNSLFFVKRSHFLKKESSNIRALCGQYWPLSPTLSGQFLPTFCPAISYNISSAFLSHSFSKTMNPFSTSFAGLICPFHFSHLRKLNYSFYICELRYF